jgi:hypothetical protein
MAEFPDGPSQGIFGNETYAPRSYSALYGGLYVSVSAIGVLSFIAAVLYVYFSRKKMVSLIPIWIFYVGIFDFISDVTFAATFPDGSNLLLLLRMCLIIFNVVSAVSNLIMLSIFFWWCLYRGGEVYGPFRKWLIHNRITFYTCLFFSFTGARFVTLIHCRLFDSDKFSAPLPISAIDKLDLLGMITVFFEDIPQMILNIIVSTATNTWDSVAYTQLSLSVLSVAVGALCRGYTLILLVDSERVRHDIYPSDFAKAHVAYEKGSVSRLRYMFDSGGDHMYQKKKNVVNYDVTLADAYNATGCGELTENSQEVHQKLHELSNPGTPRTPTDSNNSNNSTSSDRKMKGYAPTVIRNPLAGLMKSNDDDKVGQAVDSNTQVLVSAEKTHRSDDTLLEPYFPDGMYVPTARSATIHDRRDSHISQNSVTSHGSILSSQVQRDAISSNRSEHNLSPTDSQSSGNAQNARAQHVAAMLGRQQSATSYRDSQFLSTVGSFESTTSALQFASPPHESNALRSRAISDGSIPETSSNAVVMNPFHAANRTNSDAEDVHI